jgi:Na+/melibiose symporter-like transporter
MLLLRYLTDYVGLAAGLAGLLIAVSKVYDAVTDPLMGWVSDNTRSRLGRRRPWLLVGTLLCGLALVALFNVPAASRARRSWPGSSACCCSTRPPTRCSPCRISRCRPR